MPKIFFKYEDSFQNQLNTWSEASLANALQKLSELEARTKQTGTPVETVTAQAFYLSQKADN